MVKRFLNISFGQKVYSGWIGHFGKGTIPEKEPEKFDLAGSDVGRYNFVYQKKVVQKKYLKSL